MTPWENDDGSTNVDGFLAAFAADDCREWVGTRLKRGYGQRYVSGRKVLVHRWVIEQVGEDQFGTPWDPTLDVLHLCDNPPCFLYWHLRLGTADDNMQDASAKGHLHHPWAEATHCKHGHEFTPENTYYRKTGGRACRACQRERTRRRRASA